MVAGVAIAVAAPYWLVRTGTPSLGLDLQVVASVAGLVAAAAAVGVAWLRGRPAGVRPASVEPDPAKVSSTMPSPSGSIARTS